jgi:hypothetical protein
MRSTRPSFWARRAIALGFAIGSGAVLAGVFAEVIPFLSGPRSPLTGLAALFVTGLVAGLLVPNVRGWVGLLAGALSMVALVLLGRLALVAMTGPSLLPPDAWRAGLFVGTVATLSLLSGGWLVGQWPRARGVPWRDVALARTLAAGSFAAVAVAGGLAWVMSTTTLVIPDDAAVLRITVSSSGIEMPDALPPGEYHIVVTSRVLETRGLMMVGVNSDPIRPLTDQDVDLLRSGAWRNNGESTPPAFHFAGVPAKPGETYGGRITLERTGGKGAYAWYTYVPDEPAPSGDEPWVDGLAPPPVPWPPEHLVLLAITG